MSLSGVSLRSPPATLSKEQMRVKASMLAASAAANDDYEDDADAGNKLTDAEENARKAAIQERIRKEQAEGPPPDMGKRALIFDSLSKIISRNFGKGAARAGVAGETRGTYVFTWGAGYHGQLGREFLRGRKKYATIPKMVHLDVAVRQISCGGLHTAAVTDAGTVYTWGDARQFQLGYQPPGFTNQPTPLQVKALTGEFITAIACGQAHTVALSDKNQLWSWGQSKHGACGQGSRGPVKSPKLIRPDTLEDKTVKFTQVSCGDKHSAALTTKGTVWAWGSCQQGQGGFDESPHLDKLVPTEVKSLSEAKIEIASVVCGSIHTCMVTKEGALYICGFGEHFYPNEDQNFFYRPVQVPFHEKVVQVACGQSHILCLTASADVYTLGSGLYGQLGQGVKSDLNVPRLVLTGKNIAQVAAGRYHSVALTSFGTLYTFGCGESGQLGHTNDENILFPKVVEANLGTVVGQIACGEHHTAVLTSTPWERADPQVEEWLRAEQEEYALKLKFIKRSNHGLVKKDLLRIQERMQTLKAEWAAAKLIKDAHEEQELAGHIKSVMGRPQLLDLIAEEARQKAAEREGAGGHSTAAAGSQQWQQQRDYSYDAGESKEGDRPDSASHPLRSSGGYASGSQTARGLNKTAGASSLPRRPQQAAPQTSRLGGGASDSFSLTSGAALASSGDVIGSNAARCNFLRESAGMVRRMKGVIAESGDASTDARLKKTLTGVFSFRKDFDSLVNLTRKKQKILEQIQRKVASLRRTNDSSSHRRRIHDLLLKALQMKLSTVSIKLTETDENRRNYALNIAHLKEEELERFYQLESLRKQVNENEIFTRKVNEMKLQACEESAKAENELYEFKNEIAQFHAFVQDQLQKFQTISSLAHARKAKREAEKSSRSAKTHEKINLRIARLQGELSEKTNEAISMSSQLDSVNERLRYFEKRFQSIASATGLTDPNAIINKFSLKEEIRAELQAEIKAKTELLKEMHANLAALRAELVEAQSGYQESKWKDVDVLYKLVHDAQANATHHANECDRLDERLAYYKEGMLSLLSMLPEEIAPPQQQNADGSVSASTALATLEGADMSHERTMALIQTLGDRLLGLADLVAEGETQRQARLREAEEIKRAADAAQQARLAAEIAEKLKMSSMRSAAAAASSQQQQQSQQQGGYGDEQEEGDEEEEEGEFDEQQQQHYQQYDSQQQQQYSADDQQRLEEDLARQQPLQRTQQRQAIPQYADQQYQMKQY